jgi:two-component system phosphate regulon sensor histidine kinase PhoR
VARTRFLWKLYAGSVVVVVLTALIVGLLVSRRVERDSMREIERSLLDEAKLLRELARAAFETARVETLQERVHALGADMDVRFTVIGADGVVLADSTQDPARMDNHASRPEVLDAQLDGIGRSVRYSHTLDARMMYVALPVQRDEQLDGFVRTALPLLAVGERLARVRAIVAFAAAVAVVAALIIGYFIDRRISKPLTSMTRAAEALAAGDYTRSPYAGRRDEVGALARALNEMAAQLRERLDHIAADRNEVLAILASMVEGVVAVDLDERIVHINEAAGEILHVAARESMGKHVWEVTRMHEVAEAVSRAIETAAGVTAEITVPAPAGDRVIELHAAPRRDGEGRPAGAVVVLHDVTRLRGLERVRRDFVANVSHEIKTPLTAVRGLIETLLDDAGMDEETRRRFLGKARDQAARLNALVTDLLALSRLESNEQPLERARLDLRGPVEESVRALLPAAEQKRLAVETALPGEPVEVFGDESALRQAVENLLDNAVKYTPDGGRIWVRLRREGETAVVEIEDTGIGIEPAEQPRVFERFYRVDKARSRELGGTGLGLSIVKHIALAHDGDVSVESLPGRGSTFRIHLPLAASTDV